MVECNVQIEELKFSVRNSCLKLAKSLLCHIWKLVPPDVTHVISFTRLPLFSRACNVEKVGEPGDKASIVQGFSCKCSLSLHRILRNKVITNASPEEVGHQF